MDTKPRASQVGKCDTRRKYHEFMDNCDTNRKGLALVEDTWVRIVQECVYEYVADDGERRKRKHEPRFEPEMTNDRYDLTPQE